MKKPQYARSDVHEIVEEFLRKCNIENEEMEYK